MEEYNKKKYRLMQMMAGACIGVFIVVFLSAIMIVPKMNHAMRAMENIQSELDQQSLNELTAHVDALIVTLNEEVQNMTDKLEQMDMKNLNEAIKNLSNAAEKMDMEELNRAIANLSDIIEPLAKFMSR